MSVFERKKTVLIRFIAFCSVRIKAQYRYKNILQISPVPEDAPQLDVEVGEHPFIVEYSFPKPNIDEIREISERGLHEHSDRVPDFWILNDYSRQKQREIIGLLSLLFDTHITPIKTEHKWTIRFDNGKIQTENLQTGYSYNIRQYGKKLIRKQNAEIEKVPPNVHFNKLGHVVGTPAQLPYNIDSLLNHYFSLYDSKKEVFNSSVALFNKSIQAWKESSSLMFLGMVSAIENLISHEYRGIKTERCKCCGQPIYSVRQKFLAFMLKYASKAPEYRKVADEMYKIRSGIGHQGVLLAGDIIGKVVSAEDGSTSTFNALEIMIACRIALVNWLSNN